MGFLKDMKEQMKEVAADPTSFYKNWSVASIQASLEEEQKKIGPWKDKDKIAVLEQALEEHKIQEAQAEKTRIEQLAKLGIDESKLNIIYEDDGSLNLTDLTKLDSVEAFNKSPLDLDDPIIAGIYPKPPMMKKEKWKENHANAKLTYVYVIEYNLASLSLFLVPDEDSILKDRELLHRVGRNIAVARANNDKKYKKMIKEMNDESSVMKFEVDPTLCEGHKMRIITDYTRSNKLPNEKIPYDRIVAMLYNVNDHKIKGRIPGEYYVK